MSPLEAARELDDANLTEVSDYALTCPFCGGLYISGEGGKPTGFDHYDVCPWLMLPQIVAALEQGERLRAAIDELKRPLQRYMDGGGGSCDCLDCPEEPGRPICCGTCWYCHGQAAMLQARAALHGQEAADAE